MYSVAAPDFPSRLRKLMDDVGYGTVKLATDSGVNKDTIRLWRKGQKRYTVEKVARVARQLGTTAEDLLEIPPSARKKSSEVRRPRQDPERKLLRRIADLGPVIEKLPELEELVAEARKLSDG